MRSLRSGVLLVDKPTGMSSHDCVRRVRRIFGQREVGHTGTLDPNASGLMVLTLGRATRLSRYFTASTKRYTGHVRLGIATDTYDAVGKVVEEAPLPVVDEAALESVLAQLRGEIDQAVPPYSAVKVKGERLYSKARRGEAVETPLRRVRIITLELRALDLPVLEIDTVVSKGTYIRSLAVQIGEGLGVPAHLEALRRTEVGRFALHEARALDALEGSEDELMAPADALDLRRIELSEEAARDVSFGRPLRAGAVQSAEVDFKSGETLALIGPDGALWAVAEALGDASRLDPGEVALKYACVLRSAGAAYD